MPRSIDKIRATFPGGKLGAYTIAGFTQTMLDHLGIALDRFADAVRHASDDTDVAAFVAEHAKAGGIETWHAYVCDRKPRGGDRVAALEAYPFLAGRPDLVLSLDVLEEDDRVAFAR